MPAEKCPDCGTWWRGAEHRCPPMQAANSTSVESAAIVRQVSLLHAEAIREALLSLKRARGVDLGLA